MVLLGAHQSIAGGLHRAFDRINLVGGESLQIFTSNQRQWRSAPLPPEDVLLFKNKWEQSGRMPVASHASYLINLASVGGETAVRSVVALIEELQRCLQLGIDYLVLHPGSHGGAGPEAGLAEVVRNLDCALERAGVLDSSLRVLLETTAGQGTALGSRFEELGWLLGQSRHSDHLGVCVDTCHIFAAGYGLDNREAYEGTFADLERHIGCGRIHLFHLNDSQKALGSRVDRHEHIGEGLVGLDGFRYLLRDPRFSHHPMILETPKGKDLEEDKRNLRVLRGLAEETV